MSMDITNSKDFDKWKVLMMAEAANSGPQESVPMNATGIEAEVCRDIAERQRIGKIKYGHELADNNATLTERIQHAYEESLDMAVYLKWSLGRIAELDAQLADVQKVIEQALKNNRTCTQAP